MDLDEFSAELSDAYQRLWLMAAALAGDRAQADDLVQEAALIALQRRRQFESGSNFAAWMGTILRFVAANHNRLRSRRNTAAVDPGELDRTIAAADLPRTNLQNIVETWRQPEDEQEGFDDRVVRALKSLSPDARICLLLFTVEELPYAEIAELLDIPEGTAMSHVSRAKRALRDRLRAHDLPLPKTVSSVQ